MSAVGVTCSRTVGQARNLCSTALAIGGFLAATAALFAFSLADAEGTRVSVSTLWVSAVTPVLPLLCSVLAMDVWSEERRTGRIEMLLSLPVSERDLVVGKFLGAFSISFAVVVFSLVANVCVLLAMARPALAGAGFLSFLPGLAALAAQCALYTAVAVAVSAFVTGAMAAVTLSSAIVWALPRGVWMAAVAWFPSGSEAFGEFPLDAHAADLANGDVSIAVLAFYGLFTWLALFVAWKAVFALRFRSLRNGGLRLSTAFAMLLAAVFAVIAEILVVRRGVRWNLNFAEGGDSLSPRTISVLKDADEIDACCFVSRSDRRFRMASRLLRSLSRESRLNGGENVHIRYVDPRWDLGEASRLTRDGVTAPSIVFSNRRRRVSVRLTDALGEYECASAIMRLVVRQSRNVVYWTSGHGETPHDDYGPAGFSDIARNLFDEGYRNARIDLTGEAMIPADCALIAVAGARNEFSRAEVARLESFLRQGGRLLILSDGAESPLMKSLLPSWGAIARGVAKRSERTLTGTDAVISEFGTHQVVAPLKGSQIVLESPVVFEPSAAAGVNSGADSIDFTPLASVDSLAAAVMLERGAGAGSDTAIRPTRIAVIGDASFVRNAQLRARANANRDLFLNCVSYLSGSQAITGSGIDGGLLATRLDRRGRLRLLYADAGAIPLAVSLMMLLVVWRRRRRR